MSGRVSWWAAWWPLVALLLLLPLAVLGGVVVAGLIGAALDTGGIGP